MKDDLRLEAEDCMCVVSNGDLIFNLTQADTLKSIQQQHPNTLILSLHDDHFVLGDPSQAFDAAKCLGEELKSIGLYLNMGKSKIYLCTPDSQESSAGTDSKSSLLTKAP
jgi:hypothetical protein